MGVLGSIGINIGQNMQADGILSLPPEQRDSEQWRSPMWRVGMAIFVSFSILNFAALGLAPASILVPLESIQFVTNVFYSRLVHKKTVPLRMAAGVTLAVLGTVLTVTFGASGGGCSSIDKLEAAWTTVGWWLLVAVSVTVAIIALCVHGSFSRRLAAFNDGQGEEPAGHEFVLPITFTLLSPPRWRTDDRPIEGLLELSRCSSRARSKSSRAGYSTSPCSRRPVRNGLGDPLTVCLGLYDPLLILPLMVATYILFAASRVASTSTSLARCTTASVGTEGGGSTSEACSAYSLPST